MKPIKMMIVDANRMVRALIKYCLDWSAQGVELCAEAASGEEALSLLDKHQPELVLMDINLPRMTGLRLAESIRQRLPETRILIISGHDTLAYARQCIRLGITDYLLKPISEHQLEHIIRTIVSDLRSAAAAGPSGRSVVRDVAQYLTTNFNDASLSLQVVADKFYLNPSYLSRAFHEDTGSSFVTTLTRLRMEEALRLLKTTSLCGYEIGARVGIPDPKYFGACFKKHTGQTLQAFRRAQNEQSAQRNASAHQH